LKEFEELARKFGYESVNGTQMADPRHGLFLHRVYRDLRPEDNEYYEHIVTHWYFGVIVEIILEIDRYCAIHGHTPKRVYVDGPGVGTIWSIVNDPSSGEVMRLLSPAEVALIIACDEVLFLPGTRLAEIKDLINFIKFFTANVEVK
jgi:hypothetical protein